MTDLLARYRHRRLDPTDRYKPLDFGGGGIIGSLNRDGRFTGINTHHPGHGFVTLTAAEPFPEAQRYNPNAVRAYRAGLAMLDGFGLGFELPIVEREAWLLEDAIPHLRLTLENGVTADVTTFVPAGRNGVIQHWHISGGCNLAYRWRGTVSLQRCAYTQLTEGGPIPPPSPATNISLADGCLILENFSLGWSAAITIPAGDTRWSQAEDGLLDLTVSGSLNHGSTLVTAIGLGGNPAAAQNAALTLARSDPDVLLAQSLEEWRSRWQGWALDDHPLDAVLRRGLVYSLLCAVPVGETICLLTDHQLLPLSWNRDSYYAARALLAWRSDMVDLVRRHLLWLFEVAERPDGTWGRSYLANGWLKDPAFQLDQQLFPLLELAEYVETSGDRATLKRLRRHIGPLVEHLLAREAPPGGLFPTDETPADDPVVMPFHLSSHILFWHTCRKMAALLDNDRFAGLAQRVHDAVWRHFVTERNGQPLFAYLTDGAGRHHLYHDANDLPLALAPLWGFCAAADPVWRATMAFAFSEANQGGYYPGPCGGLGSVHTRAPWPLGDAHELLYAQLTGDSARQEQVTRRLATTAQWDGALPEACDASTGAVVSRHWFAWPGAALALLALEYRRRSDA